MNTDKSYSLQTAIIDESHEIQLTVVEKANNHTLNFFVLQ